ncbi:MAG: GDSL-type esterase/lipase family protein [Planctomycetota bacterium]
MSGPRSLARRLLLVLVPLALIVAIELFFRLLGLFAPPEHFKEIQSPDGTVRRTIGNQLPSFATEDPCAFAPQKEPGVFRVFVVGESSVQGFPFFPWSSVPAIMQARLAHLCPGRKVQVINAGKAGYTIEQASEVVAEALRYEPDLILVYSGHNEFMISHRLEIEQDMASWQRLLKALGRTRVVRALQRATGLEPRERFGHPVPIELAQVNDESHVRPDLLEAGYVRYENYLDRLVTDACGASVPIMVSKLVCNLAGQAPYWSWFGRLTDEQEKEHYRVMLKEAVDLYEKGAKDRALELLEPLRERDPTVATVWYLLGNIWRERGHLAEARDALERARDLDGLPQRATSRLNAIVEEVARRHMIPLIDPWPAFTAAAKDSIPGFDLLCDYCHPNLEGQWVLADALLQAMRSVGLPIAAADWLLDQEPDRQAYRAELGLRSEDFARSQTSAGNQLVKQALLKLELVKLLRQADAFYGRALEAVPGWPEALAGRAVIAVLRGEKEHALELFAKAVSGEPLVLEEFARAYEEWPLFRERFTALGLVLTRSGVTRQANGGRE